MISPGDFGIVISCLNVIPIADQTYFARIGFNSATVFFGQNFLSVRNEFFSAEWQCQLGSAGIFAIACATIFFAASALRCRLAMTISSVTCASSVFQQS